jgi:hypothetical protein
MMFVEKFIGKNEVLGENLPQCYTVHHKSHMTGPGTKHRLPQWKVQQEQYCCYATIVTRNMHCFVTAGKHINNIQAIAR